MREGIKKMSGIKLELCIPRKLKNDIKKIKPKNMSLKDYIKSIIRNEVNSRLDDLFNYSTFL